MTFIEFRAPPQVEADMEHGIQGPEGERGRGREEHKGRRIRRGRVEFYVPRPPPGI